MRSFFRTNLAITVCSVTALFCGASWANLTASDVPTGAFYLSQAKPGWHYDAYLGVGSEPTYAGSKRSEIEAEANARAFYVTGEGDRYFVSLGELGGYWQLSNDLQFVAFVEFEEGREQDDDKILVGMDDVRSTVEGQFLLVQRFGNAYASVTLQPDLLDRGKGLVWFLAFGHDWFINDNFRVSMNLDVSGANSAYMNTEFGVSQREAEATGLAFYEPSSGLKSISTQFETEYFFDQHWSVLTSLEWESYLDAAADSPLVKDEGDKNTLSASVLIRYRF